MNRPGSTAPTLYLRNLMRPVSRVRYLVWRVAGAKRSLTVQLSGGPRLVIRPAPAGDLSVAHEIFVQELYRSPRPLASESVRRIVDVGANVGYAISYFAHSFPAAAIVAFEPHPAHLSQIAQNLAANRLEGRVTIVPAAAGVATGQAFLTDSGEASHLVVEAKNGQIPVPVVDFFATVGEGPIDLLKMDCEGAEYDLLIDDRFATLNPRGLVLEWHTSRERPHADEAICARLTNLGFVIEKVMEYSIEGNRFGLLWAYPS